MANVTLFRVEHILVIIVHEVGSTRPVPIVVTGLLPAIVIQLVPVIVFQLLSVVVIHLLVMCHCTLEFSVVFLQV